MRTSVLYTVLGIALVIGTACKGPDGPDTNFDVASGLARGANVVPLPTVAADTLPQASIAFNIASRAYSYTISAAPSGTLDSIALYQVAAGTALPANATVMLCAGAAACAATSGTGSFVGAATEATVRTSIRGYGTQVVFFTTTARTSGAMRGTLYPSP